MRRQLEKILDILFRQYFGFFFHDLKEEQSYRLGEQLIAIYINLD